MADLAITGISKVVVEELMKKVKSAIKEETELWEAVQRDVVFIQEEFEMMKSFFDSGDGGRVKNTVGRTWVGQIRNLSYDTEDCMDFIFHMDTRRTFRTFLRHLLASCTCKSGASSSPLNEAVAELRMLRARVEEVSKRKIRYGITSDSSSGPVMPQQLSSIDAPTFGAPVDILTEARCTAKKQGALADLTMLITEKTKAHRVVSVWGSGGDVASIIKEAYDQQKIRQTFRCRAWLKLERPFNSHEFIRNLADQFHGTIMEQETQGSLCSDARKDIESIVRTAVDPVKDFVQKIKAHRYLVVLEDLSSMAEWHFVRTYLPQSENGSRIVVSTEQFEIARLCAGQPCQVLQLRKLSNNHSVCVFFNEGFKRVEEGEVVGGQFLLETANHFLQNFHLVGRDREMDQLLNLVSSQGQNGRHHRVISVWGFPGVGKSALVRTFLYQHVVGKKLPFQFYAWVDVSHPFSLGDFCRRILSSRSSIDDAYILRSSSGDEDAIKECENLLKDTQCLVVVDDLRSNEEWDMMKKLIREASKSCVIAITTEESVAKHCATPDHPVPYKVKALDSEAAFQHFEQAFGQSLKQHPFGGSATFRHPYMLQEAKHVLAKCGGVPEVITALATYLATQQEDTWQWKLNRLKANFMHELETSPEFVSLGDLFTWIHFNFDDFPRSLKPCMLYLSAFPQGKSTRRSRFVRRWIAEGYTKRTDSKTMEEYVGKLFGRLAEQTPIISEYQNISFFREYINSRITEEAVFLFPLDVSVLEGNDNLCKESQGQHLTIGSSWKRDESLFDDLDFSQLQSLTVSGEWKTFFISCKMKSLRVLDLEDAKDITHEELKRILELVPRLRFLSLRGHEGITRLPDTLSGLKNLQTLDIRNTSVMLLDLRKLEKLHYIRAGTNVPWIDIGDGSTAERQSNPSISRSRNVVSRMSKIRHGHDGSIGVKVHGGIRNLKVLHTLGAVNINTSNGKGMLEEICLLKQLKKLQVCGINRKNSQNLSRAIMNLQSLESLSLQLEKENHVLNWDHISPPTSVLKFKLRWHVKELPALRFKDLNNLRKLVLEMTALLTPLEIRDQLGSLKSLRTLRLLVNEDQVGALRFPTDRFSELHDLEIACKCSMLHVSFGDGSTKKLEVLKLECRAGSSIQVSDLENAISLKQVWLKGSWSGNHKDALQEQLDKHRKKHGKEPALLLEEPSSSR